jgi:flagellin-like protein
MRECGVSPVVATIILIAITLSISMSLASQVINLWVTSGSSEALQIGGEVVKVGSDVEVNVVVVNKGSAVGNITEVLFYDDLGKLIRFTGNTIPKELQYITPSTSITSTLGTVNTEYSGSVTVTLGRVYVVRFYTSTGNIYEVVMRCNKIKEIQPQPPPEQPPQPPPPQQPLITASATVDVTPARGGNFTVNQVGISVTNNANYSVSIGEVRIELLLGNRLIDTLIYSNLSELQNISSGATKSVTIDVNKTYDKNINSCNLNLIVNTFTVSGTCSVR